jgi:type VI secretion system protein ImpH
MSAQPPAPHPDFSRWLHGVASAPYRFDFYQTLRHIESANPQLPRLGEAVRPADEPVRIAQAAELTFAPAPLHGVVFPEAGTPRIVQRIFGLIGPNGPLPMHLTELARERSLQHADPALLRLLDTLTHRFALLFYRAWAQAQPVLSLDRSADTQFARRLGSLFGLGSEAAVGRDAVGDQAKLHFAGRLARQTRDADGLLAWCRSEFGAAVAIEQWSGHWMRLSPDERTRLRSREGQALGQGAVLGASAWDVQHKFRIVIGPLPMEGYLAFLPGGRDLDRLRGMVRQWVGLEFAWDLQLILARAEVPRLTLGAVAAPAGRPGRLGNTTWLGRFTRESDAKDLVIDVEAVGRSRLQQRAAAAAAAAAIATASSTAAAA